MKISIIKMVKFSIIITTKDRKKLFERAFKSAVNQNFDDYEIVIVNNGNEPVEDIVSKYSNLRKIKLINYSERQSPAISANIGIKNSEGEWICFLDDDDELLEDYLKTINENLDEKTSWIVIKMILKDDKGYKAIMPNLKVIQKQLNNDLFKELLKISYFGKPMNIIKKEIFQKIGLFLEDLEVAEDYEFVLRLAKNGYKPKIIEEPIYIYYIHLGQTTKKYKKFFIAFTKIYKKYKKDIYKHKDVLSYKYYRLGWYLVYCGEERKAYKYFKKSFILYPNLKSLIRLIMAKLELNRRFNFEKFINKILGKYWID